MPTTEQAEGEKVHRLHMNFNFHKDIATLDHENRPLVIKQHLASRSEAYVMSKRIAESIPNYSHSAPFDRSLPWRQTQHFALKARSDDGGMLMSLIK